jgi:carbon-monoxide dehydrogenase medium subunit
MQPLGEYMNLVYHHTLPCFERYLRPKSVEEATSLLTDHGKEARILAGGTDLLVLMRSRAVTPRFIIDMNGIPGLDYTRHDERDFLRIGPLVRLRMAEFSDTVRRGCPALVEAICQMATPQVRNMGTIVGNICRASPAGDTIPPLLCSEASVTIVGSEKSRLVPLEEFFRGPGETVLGRGEIVGEGLSASDPEPG